MCSLQVLVGVFCEESWRRVLYWALGETQGAACEGVDEKDRGERSFARTRGRLWSSIKTRQNDRDVRFSAYLYCVSPVEKQGLLCWNSFKAYTGVLVGSYRRQSCRETLRVSSGLLRIVMTAWSVCFSQAHYSGYSRSSPTTCAPEPRCGTVANKKVDRTQHSCSQGKTQVEASGSSFGPPCLVFPPNTQQWYAKRRAGNQNTTNTDTPNSLDSPLRSRSSTF